MSAPTSARQVTAAPRKSWKCKSSSPARPETGPAGKLKALREASHGRAAGARRPLAAPTAPQTPSRLPGAFWRLAATCQQGRERPLSDSPRESPGHVPRKAFVGVLACVRPTCPAHPAGSSAIEGRPSVGDGPSRPKVTRAVCGWLGALESVAASR